MLARTSVKSSITAALGVLVLALAAFIVDAISESRPTPARAQVSEPVVVMAAGDIACGSDSFYERCVQKETSDLLVTADPSVVLTLGDLQYECGEASDFTAFYDPAWGRKKTVTRPVPGNHEYLTSTDAAHPCYGNPSGAKAYFDYFGAAAGEPGKGYYSYSIGSTHFIALNSNCSMVSCSSSSAQVQWLKADLAANADTCTIAYWHHPRFSSSIKHPNDTRTQAFWDALHAGGADVVLNGHAHNYERFARQGPSGGADANHGLRQFIVGTGGKNYTALGTRQPNSEVFHTGTFGVLRLAMYSDRYEWSFVPIAGSTSGFSDSGSTACHGAPTATPGDTTAPVATAPALSLPIARLGSGTVPVKVTWSATDNSGTVASYEVQRSTDGGAFTGVSLATATTTTTTQQLAPSHTYQYRVRAKDTAGNTSAWATGRSAYLRASNESSSSLTYGGTWTTQAVSGAFGGYVKYRSASGGKATYTFTGTDVSWVSTRGANRGKAEVWLDGALMATVDLYRSSTSTRETVFTRGGLSPSVTHTLEIRVTGTRNASSTGTRVDVDAFAVLR